jgi:hypothetical protein
MTVKIENWKQNSVDDDLHTLVVSFELPMKDPHPIMRSMFRLHARHDAFDVQTGDNYVLIYGKANSLEDAKGLARAWLIEVLADIREQV